MALSALEPFDAIIRTLDTNGIYVDDAQREQIHRILTNHEHDRNQVISALIQIYYGLDSGTIPFDVTLSVKAVEIILYRYFKITDLDTTNVIAMVSALIPKLPNGHCVDTNKVADIMEQNAICGQHFVNGTSVYMKPGKFTNLFKSLENWKKTKKVFRAFWKEMNEWRPLEVWMADTEVVEEEEKKEDTPIYEEGKIFEFWNPNRPKYIEPMYRDLREELLANGSRTALRLFNLLEIWNGLKTRVGKLLENGTNLTVTSNGKYQIPREQPIDEEHMMALLIHTDLTKVDKEYSDILRRGDPNEVSSIAHWARLLTETVQCFGKKIVPKLTYYRAVDKAFVFKMPTMRFNLPMSTSISVSLC